MSPEELMRWRIHHHSVSTGDDWWRELDTDAAWDAPQLERVRARLAAQFGLAVAADAVECKTRCCRIRLSEDDAARAGDELLSSVGLGFGAVGGRATSGSSEGQVTFAVCWRRDDDRAYPDRAAERAALLARAAPALTACGRGVTPPITVRVTLELDPAGEVAELHSNAADLGSAAARCAERALVEAADFAPAPEPSVVPLTAILGA